VASAYGFSTGNISLVDDRLIRAGVFALCLALILLGIYLNLGRAGFELLFLWIVGIAAVGTFLLVAGISARKREKKCIGLWRLLQTHPDIKLSLYMEQSGNSLTDVQRASSIINESGAGFLVVDSKNDRLYDSRLNIKESVTFQCTNCGASSTSSIGLIESTAIVCQYCQAPAPDAVVPSMSDKHEFLIRRNSQTMSVMSLIDKNHHKQESSSISIPLFIFLLVFFWPGALLYVLWKKMVR